MEDPLNLLMDKDHQVLMDPWTSEAHNSAVTLDTSALENTFGSVGQSMLQLARAQDQTNRQLQQHIQQEQINMQAHTGALQQLLLLPIKEISIIYLQVYPYMTEVIGRVSFLG